MSQPSGPDLRIRSSTPTPSAVRFHDEEVGEGAYLREAFHGVERRYDLPNGPSSEAVELTTVPLGPSTTPAFDEDENGRPFVTLHGASEHLLSVNGSNASGRRTVQWSPDTLEPTKDVVLDIRGGGDTISANSSLQQAVKAPLVGHASSATALPVRAKSISHWHDSRISVENHLALQIEDLMLLAPGAADEKKKDGEGGDAAQASGEKANAPVDFDEDEEPDSTLEHVLAGVEYLLHTRIIGSTTPAVGGPSEDIAEEDEEKESDGDDEEEDVAPAVDANGMPAPLVAAPQSVADQPSGTTVDGAATAPPVATVAGSSPYFYFVSLDLAICDDLTTVLCYHMRRTEKKWSLRPKATPEAKKAMQIFEGFFTYVYSFRCAVAARPTSYLRASLKVGRHMRDPDQAHRRLCVKLLLLLTAECPRIEKWEDLVDVDDQDKVREVLRTRELRKLQQRLAGEKNHRADREESISRQSSFRVSRESKDVHSGQSATGGTAAATAFPKFFSVRHNKLLPPKGACYDVEPKRLIQMFHTDMKTGLKTDEIEERQTMYGKNELPPPHQESFLALLWAQFQDFIILILLAASVVSFAIQDWEAGGVLLFVVLVNVAIGLIQEYRSANALKALNSFSIPQATVIRDGETSVMAASELVPGDIVLLEEGANIPADLRLLEVAQLATIEAILTGESLPIPKSTPAIKPRGSRRYLAIGDRVNMAFMSTLVSKGRAVGLVVNTGATTEVGRIYAALQSSAAETIVTPLQRKLARLGKWLVLIAVLACAAVIAIGLGRGYGTDIVHIGISLAVSVIPEGLVTIVTLTMAIGTQRMAAKKAIARNLPAVETIGAITTICSDKTGTLTEGKMKTESMWAVASTTQGQGHTLRFITASKAAPKPPPASANGVVPAAAASSASPDGATGSSEAAALIKNANPSPDALAAPSGAPVPASVSVLLDNKTTIQSSDALPVPLLWNNLNCSLNNNAVVKLQEVLGANGKITMEEVMVGDATEIALLRATQQAFCDIPYWTQRFGLKRTLEFAFDSDRKRMSVILELPEASADATFLGVARPSDAAYLLLVKGAPEAVLNKSVSYLSTPDSASNVHQLTPLNDAIESDIESQGSHFASEGMRVLATAFRFLSAKQVAKYQADLQAAIAAAEAAAAAKATGEKEAKPAASSGPSGADLVSFEAECELTFIGLNGIMDPPRVEVADAIRVAHAAGIRVCMITGDHYDTAVSIAKQIGIYDATRGDRAMNGDALAVLSEEQLSVLDPFPVVFSRVSPENKLKLVKSLQRRGEICAMTGDGVNDSPAIKQANVGIAMGLSGTEVTRQSADIILSDDNFSTIVSSVGEGRRIYDNIVKFLTYLLTCNGAEVWVVLFAVVLGMPSPFLSLMLLWANIFADIPPSLSLGLEEGEADAMERPPRPTDQSILTLRVAAIILFDSGMMAVIVLVNFYHVYGVRDLDINYAETVAFEMLAVMHLVHSFAARSLTETMFKRNIFSSNPALVFSLFISFGFIVGGCYIPGLNDILELQPLRGLEWGIIAINICAQVAITEARKFLLRRWDDRRMAQLRAGAAGAGIPPTKRLTEETRAIESAEVAAEERQHLQRAEATAVGPISHAH